MSRAKTFRKALLGRQAVLGSWIQIGACPGVAEILANAGYDWLAIDCEHSDIDVAGVTALARGMYGRGPVPLVRVRENDTLAIRQVLDAGAQGVIVPLVDDAAAARRAVAAAKYPPQGVRGFCFSRMNDYGVAFDAYAAAANDETAVIVMVESRRAVEEIDTIAAVEGVDGVLIGPYDLSGSYGVTGQTGHPLLQEARRKVADACRRHGRAAGLHLVHPAREAVRDAIRDGFTFLALGVDMVFLNEGARAALGAAREVLDGK